MRIGLLDFGVRSENINSMSIIEDVIEYAIKADELGYNRFWLSEHHNFDPLSAWFNPEVLLPIIAGVTNKIRVGSGGILLGNHSPYRVAYTFKLLNNLFSNRIDLGIAKGYTLRNINSPNNSLNSEVNQYNIHEFFEQNISSLLNYLNNEDELFDKEIIIPPYKGEIPEIWSLTSSYKNLEKIAEQGLNISRSIFHNGADINYHKDQLESFKEKFISIHNRAPKISIAFSGCCNKDEKKARTLFESYPYAFVPDNIVGSPSYFEDKLSELEYKYGISEFIFMNVALDPKYRNEGIELIASQIKFSE